MRIVGSKFKDYYDGVAGLGYDSDLIFLRSESERSDLGMRYPSREFEYQTNKKKYVGSHGALGFCGKFYQYICLKSVQEIDYAQSKIYGKTIYAPNETIWCYTAKQWRQFTNQNPKQTNGLQRRIYSHFRYSYLSNSTPATDDRTVEAFFTPTENLEVFFKANAPILIPVEKNNRSYYIQINGCLRNFGFERCFDPYSAFQEISMFVGGVLPNSKKEMIEISDVSKRDKAGFDVMSFKTYPTKKRRGK